VLQRRLISVALLSAVGLVAVTGCGDKPIEDVVVRPGITAIQEARDDACGLNARTLRTALDAYEMLEDEPAPDEQALIDAGFLRETTSDWDVVDGELIAENPACGAVPVTSIDDIVTSTAPVLSADEILAGWSDEQIDQVGGAECASELAAIFAGADRYVAEQGAEPTDFQDLVDAGYLTDLPTMWVADGDQLVPAADSGCADLPSG
jgi:hypothetical protein